MSANYSAVDDDSDDGVDFSADDVFEVSERDPSRVPCAVLGYDFPPLIVPGSIAPNGADFFIEPRDAVDVKIPSGFIIEIRCSRQTALSNNLKLDEVYITTADALIVSNA